jgi:hypothetical protein
MPRTPERTEFLKDLIITAVEGGIGYWAEVRRYNPDEGTVEVRPQDECATEDPNPWRTVTVATIAKGIGRIDRGDCTFGGEPWAFGKSHGRVMVASRANDAGLLDADDADNILQAALFGDIVYG